MVRTYTPSNGYGWDERLLQRWRQVFSAELLAERCSSPALRTAYEEFYWRDLFKPSDPRRLGSIMKSGEGFVRDNPDRSLSSAPSFDPIEIKRILSLLDIPTGHETSDITTDMTQESGLEALLRCTVCACIILRIAQWLLLGKDCRGPQGVVFMSGLKKLFLWISTSGVSTQFKPLGFMDIEIWGWLRPVEAAVGDYVARLISIRSRKCRQLGISEPLLQEGKHRVRWRCVSDV